MNANDSATGRREEQKSVGVEHINQLLTVAEVASMLRVHPESVCRWHDEGRLFGYRIGRRGKRRFREEAVENFLSVWPVLARESVIDAGPDEFQNC